MRIDSHHHFWKYTVSEFGWIGPGMERLQSDFLPPDLRSEIDLAGIDGAISVQARQTEEETRWLLELAGQRDFIKGVVGWVPLVSPKVASVLEELSGAARLRGVRHVLHDEPDDQYMLRTDFNEGVSLLARYGLVYDILIFERHLPQTIAFVDRHPNQPFVLDHIGKPLIAKGEIEPWGTRMRELAKRRNVSCKVSGMVTEASWTSWTPASLQPYFDTVLEAFGPDRLMFGSDWPVSLLASEYGQWVDTVEELAGALTPDETTALFGGTAARVYGLKP